MSHKKLSSEFTRDIYEDGIKIALIPGKIMLESVCCWPGDESTYMKIVSWILFWNLVIVEIFHVTYVIKKFSDTGDVIYAGMTITTNLEALVRIYIILLKRGTLNEILVKIWKQFWPLTTVTELSTRRNLNKRAKIPLFLASIFLIAAIIGNCGLSMPPLIKHDLIMRSVFPFNWDRLYLYEVIYVWQYYSDWFVLFVATSFDFFFVSLISVCTLQFVILQEVWRKILSPQSRKHRKIIFGDDGGAITDEEMLEKCLEQHKLLVGICNDLEESFNKVILIQFVVSIAANCASFLVMKLNSDQIMKIISYAISHLSQLFYYCFVGQQLSDESTNLSDAIYECEWHKYYDRDFRKALVLIIQRCQRKQHLTAIGLFELNFESFVKILRITFSFYTMLDKVLMEKSQLERDL